jgi:metal-dependent hydrolase (beta-lactamase superfamily II)
MYINVIQVVIFQVVMPCSAAYQCFGGPHCLCPFPSAIHFTMKMKAAKSSEMVVTCHYTNWNQNPKDLNLKSSPNLA